MTQKEFEQLVRQHEKLIYTVCYQLTQNHHTAQDLTQETFLAAYRRIDACDPAHYRPWLTRIAVNKAKDYLKAAARRETPTEVLPETAARDGPEELMLHTAAEEDLRKRIRALKEPYCAPAVLFFLEEKSIPEIAKTLQRPEKTVYTQLSRAKKILQKALKGGAP